MCKTSHHIDKHKSAPVLIVLVIMAITFVALPYVWHVNGLDKGGSTDYLAYLGALLGAVATIVAVVCEIRADATARKEEYELSTRPVIWCGIDHDFRIGTAPFLFEFGNHAIEQQEELVKRDLAEDVSAGRYVIILGKNDDGYTRGYKTELDESLCLEIHNKTYLINEGGGIGECASRYLTIPLIMKNVGVGPALSLCEGTRFLCETEGRCSRPPRLLGVGESIRFVICIDAASSWDFNDRFDITATYTTITGAYLRFALEVTVESDASGNDLRFTIDKQARTEVVA